ncbi:hypothetical protein [Thermomonospora catenispora]|uniref:hypothetical protein n=1 Tax=Thermomonospora catenispora TaxID=2493090 RepID=UPI0011231941|nr:hypothetical protein [Thermomonospora catenispora]TNY36816.1 hypothetical protein EIO00_10910 [Thermomonospora catenispora]
MTPSAVWILAGVGWLLVAAGLFRGPAGAARTAALAAHALTPVGVLLITMTLGYGALFALLALVAEWWAAVLVTLGRPWRLADPVRHGTARLAAWLATSGALAVWLTALIV